MQSVCIFHNGNQRIIELYRAHYHALSFRGNWGVTDKKTPVGSLYELSYADATFNNISELNVFGIQVVRHITNYVDDNANRPSECEQLNYNDWLQCAVLNNLCFSNIIKTEFIQCPISSNEHAVITTGRTASLHYRYILKEQNITAFENHKSLDERWINAGSATLLWRKDSWECLTSHFIAQNQEFVHNIEGRNTHQFSNEAIEITREFVENFVNQCLAAMNFSLYFKYILQKPIDVVTTEDILNIQTKSKKVDYNKKALILNYDQTKLDFDTTFKPTLDYLFENTQKMLQNN